MPENRKVLERFDFYLLGILVSLLFISMMVILGAAGPRPELRSLAFTQLLAIVIGMGVLIGLQVIDYRVFLDHAYGIYWTVVLLLVSVLFFGHGVRGARSWFILPIVHIRVQPSELMKVAFVFAMARYLSKRDRSLDRFKDLAVPLGFALVPFLLIVAQRDLGTASVFLPVALLMFWAAGVRPIYLFLLMSPALGVLGIRGGILSILIFLVLMFVLFRFAAKLAVSWFDWGMFLLLDILAYLGSPTVWNLLKPHQQKRLLVFLNPEMDPTGDSWNLIQSKIALGSGGIWGKGWQQGTQIRGRFLPDFHTDFVFSMLGEEWGLIGCVILMVLFFLFLMHGLEVAQSTRHYPGALLACGIVSLFFVHVIVNVGMCMGLVPVIGIPLCFVSYGGSAMVANLIAAAMLFNVQQYRFR